MFLQRKLHTAKNPFMTKQGLWLGCTEKHHSSGRVESQHSGPTPKTTKGIKISAERAVHCPESHETAWSDGVQTHARTHGAKPEYVCVRLQCRGCVAQILTTSDSSPRFGLSESLRFMFPGYLSSSQGRWPCPPRYIPPPSRNTSGILRKQIEWKKKETTTKKLSVLSSIYSMQTQMWDSSSRVNTNFFFFFLFWLSRSPESCHHCCNLHVRAHKLLPPYIPHRRRKHKTHS